MTALSTAQAHWGMRSPLPEGDYAVPTKDDVLDRRLERYLDDRDEDQRRGVTIGAVKESLQRVADWTQTHEKKDDTRHDELSKRFEALEKSHITSSVSVNARLGAMESDIRELKPAVRNTQDSIHDITEQELAAKLVESTDRHKKLVAVIWQVAIYVICAGAGVAVTYLAFRLGLTPPPH